MRQEAHDFLPPSVPLKGETDILENESEQRNGRGEGRVAKEGNRLSELGRGEIQKFFEGLGNQKD